jgi:hypothetical protein
MSDTGACKIGILERNRGVAPRIARVFRAASRFETVAVEAEPTTLRDKLAPDTRLIGCEESDLDLVLGWATHRFPMASVICWTNGSPEQVLRLAEETTRVASVIAWPSFSSMPRPWELLLAARRILGDSVPTPMANLLNAGATIEKAQVHSSEQRDQIVGRVSDLAEQLVGLRMAQRVGEVTHEMIMNAMYDAPVNQYGIATYASDRKQSLLLTDDEAPRFTFGTDGSHIALRIEDRFGRLQRQHLSEGILRGFSGQNAADPTQVLSTANGGAGLGLFRMYAASNVTIADVVPGSATVVTSLIDLDVNAREARSVPSSIHFPLET